MLGFFAFVFSINETTLFSLVKMEFASGLVQGYGFVYMAFPSLFCLGFLTCSSQ